MNCKAYNPGTQRPGAYIRIPFEHSIAAASEESVKLAPPGNQMWQLVDIVIEDNDDATTDDIPTVNLTDIEDGSGQSYFPRVGDRSDPLSELSPNVGVSPLQLQQRFKSGPGTKDGPSPLLTWSMPEFTASNPCIVKWTETAGAGADTIRGYYEVRVLSQSAGA